MAQAKEGDTVKVHYTGKLKDGTVFDQSAGKEPLEFTIGEGRVIPGFEEAVKWMEPGQSKTVEVSSEEAYGPRRDEMILQVDRSRLPEDLDPEVGQQLQSHQENGQTVILTVTDVSEQEVTLDANHPLAGQDLQFEIELVEIG